MIKSKFSNWASLTLFLIIIVSGINYLIISTLLKTDKNEVPTGVFVFIVLFLLTWLWLTVGEFRTKIIKVEILERKIIVRKFGGFGKKLSFEFNEFEGYKTTLMPSKYKTYEYLYLIKNGKKEVKISQYYHQNYSELKIELRKHLKLIKQESYSYFRDFKEIFQ